MHWGIVLHDGELGRRAVRLDLRRLSDSNWSAASQCRGIVTDRRLLAQMPQGEWVSLWWPTVVGLQITLAAQSILVDYGDGYPWHLFGPDVSVVAVAAIAAIYGTQALAEHPALAQLRTVSP
ncbi:hypothetical protein [Humibacillus xanthopallidus]|nr:hypothetical protein [Humibacillus xanthopallidus]